MTSVRDPEGVVPLWSSVEAFWSALAGRVETRLDALVDGTVEAIRAKVSAYAALSGDEMDEVQAGIMRTACLLLRTLAELRPVSDEEMTRLRAIGEQRAACGVPLEAVEEAVAIAHAEGYDHLHAEAKAMVAECPEHRVDMEAVSRHLSLHLQAFYACQWAAFRAGYERVVTERRFEGEALFFDALLRGEFPTDREVERAAAEAAVQLRAPCAILALIAVNHEGRDLRDRIRVLRPALADGIVTRTMAEPYPHAVALVPVASGDWHDLLAGVAVQVEEAGLLVVAEPAPTLASIGPTYQGFRRRLSMASKLRRPAVVHPLSLSLMWVASFLTPEERFLDVAAVLGPVLGRRADWATKDMDALRTLRDWRGDVTAASRQLGITAASLRRRVRGIERRCGLRLDNALDLATLAHAVSLYWSEPNELPAPEDPAWTGRSRATARPAGGRDGAPPQSGSPQPSPVAPRVWAGHEHLRVIDDDS